jgi:2-methylisocitrate lyase-like PEP mutase family enzyme
MGQKASRLRQLLKEKDILIVPGAYDCISAKLVENAGFDAVFLGGFALSASLLGQPDVGLLTMSEVVGQARNVVNAVGIPVLADGEDGYGGVVNVQRTVREMENAGVAGIFIEDQLRPVKCGAIVKYKVVGPAEEMVFKIKAARDARTDPNFLIGARTDADIISLDEQIRRCNLYTEAGADYVMPLADNSDDFRALVKGVKGLLWMILTPHVPVTIADLRSMGYKGIVIFPTEALLVAVKAVMNLMAELKTSETTKGTWTDMSPPSFGDFFSLMGLRKLISYEEELRGIAKG